MSLFLLSSENSSAAPSPLALRSHRRLCHFDSTVDAVKRFCVRTCNEGIKDEGPIIKLEERAIPPRAQQYNRDEDDDIRRGSRTTQQHVANFPSFRSTNLKTIRPRSPIPRVNSTPNNVHTSRHPLYSRHPSGTHCQAAGLERTVGQAQRTCRKGGWTIRENIKSSVVSLRIP